MKGIPVATLAYTGVNHSLKLLPCSYKHRQSILFFEDARRASSQLRIVLHDRPHA
jgi:hypothetical protein